MTKIATDNLYIFCTLNCNFNCAHCMRGKPQNQSITTEVLEELFSKISITSSLKLGGGEPLTDLNILRKILQIIKQKKVIVLSLPLTTNGSLFTEEAKELLDEYREYIESCRQYLGLSKRNSVQITLSADEYHENFLRKIETINPALAHQYYKNIKRLYESEYYEAYRDLNGLWNSGNATSLNQSKRETLNYQGFYYYEKENGLLWTGPIISIMPDGTFTEMNGSIQDLQTKFNYGNILKTDLDALIRQKYRPCENLDDLNNHSRAEIEKVNDDMDIIQERHQKKLYFSSLK